MKLSSRRKFLDVLLMRNNPHNLEAQDLRRVQIVNMVSLLALSITFLYFFRSDPNQNAVGLFSNIFAFVGFAAANLIARLSSRISVAFHIYMLVFMSSFFIGYFTNSATTSVLWVPLGPFVAYLFLRIRGVAIWTPIIITGSIILVILRTNGFIHIGISNEIIITSMIAVAGAALILFGYEAVSGNYEKTIIIQDNELHASNSRLESELAKSGQLAEQLTNALSESSKSISTQERTHSAMLNILDDAKILQEQLVKEKASVEQKVLQRTAQLNTEQTRLKASIESLSSGFLMTTTDDKAIIYNSALADLMGGAEFRAETTKSTSNDELLKLMKAKLPKNFDLTRKITKCMTTGTTFFEDDVTIGNQIVAITGSPIVEDSSRKPIGCVVLFTDVTETKMLERSKNEFVSIASHELRTPLTVIRGNATMLQDMYGDKMPDPDMKSMLDDIKDGSVRLISVVNEFLNMSRLEQKRAVFDLVSTPSLKYINDVVDTLKPLALVKNISLVIDVPSDLPNILTDPQRFIEILSNIVDNAVKYSDKGVVTISAKAETERVTFYITDNGKGIAKESQNLLFKKFQQAGVDILTRDVSRSTGLGLYICRLLAEQLNGSVYLEASAPGEGSTFAFTQPIAKETKMKKPE